MEYQFIRQEPCREKVIFVLTLDRKKLKERVLIGTEDEVRSRLEGNEGAELACDTTNPLGTLLIRFDKDPEGNWNRLGLAPLRDAMHTNRWEQPALEQAAGKFLSGKYQSGEPICQYTAFRIWNAYLKARENAGGRLPARNLSRKWQGSRRPSGLKTLWNTTRNPARRGGWTQEPVLPQDAG